MTWIFFFFFLSGFCSILYELVWLRLAMAKFGVTTALVSLVLSLFMAGLGLGSWIGGALLRRYGHRVKFPALRLYAGAELLIGCSALIVPLQFAWGSRVLEKMAGSLPVSSGSYYVVSGAWLALTLIPWCTAMGATIPLAMFAIRRDPRYESRRSFSFLYLSNVLGAVMGAVIPLFLIELYGFHATLSVGAAVNVLILACAVTLTARSNHPSGLPVSTEGDKPQLVCENGKGPLLLLFATGLATMGMEVIWIRLFTPYIGPLVYSFATILATYLLATFVGSQMNRYWALHSREDPVLWVSLLLFGLLRYWWRGAQSGQMPFRLGYLRWNLFRHLMGNSRSCSGSELTFNWRTRSRFRRPWVWCRFLARGSGLVANSSRARREGRGRSLRRLRPRIKFRGGLG